MPTKKEVQELYEVDKLEQIINTLPITIPLNKSETLEDFKNFSKHIKNYKKSEVYSILKNQLSDLNINIKYWKSDKLKHLYALHIIRVATLYSLSYLRKELPKIDVIRKDIKFLTLTTPKTINISEECIDDRLTETYLHELGHIIYSKLSKVRKEDWGKLPKDFISYYATISESDDFAETFRYSIVSPRLVATYVEDKYSFLSKYVFKKGI